jgi:transcriptional regulator with XRE-family HTH domain
MIDERSIAKRIREERRKAGISQDCLGKKLGVDGFYISKLENNKKGLSLNMIAEISKALHVSADYLIFGNELRNDCAEGKTANVLHGCSDNERQIIYEAVCALKQILINNRR